jgi:hypothetical protein
MEERIYHVAVTMDNNTFTTSVIAYTKDHALDKARKRYYHVQSTIKLFKVTLDIDRDSAWLFAMLAMEAILYNEMNN